MKDFERDYIDYITSHVENVKAAWEWIKKNVDLISVFDPEVNENNLSAFISKVDDLISIHDSSKWSDEEFMPYAKYFFIDKNKYSHEFEKAWDHHKKCNPHHWNYWTSEYTGKGTMYPEYIVEMVCDWWSFSFKKGDLSEIFSWYEKEKPSQVMTEETRKYVEKLLDNIKTTLNEDYNPTNPKFKENVLGIADGKVDSITVIDTNPLKVFISVPMKNRTEEDIKKSMDLMMSKVKETCPEAEMIDTWITEKPNELCKNESLWYLGKSLEFLSQADLFVGLDDNTGYVGCEIEKQTALAYDLNIMLLSRKEICPDL